LYGISFDKQSAICCVLFCTHCICVAESQLVYVLCYAMRYNVACSDELADIVTYPL
jgi:hypothetical protein